MPRITQLQGYKQDLAQKSNEEIVALLRATFKSLLIAERIYFVERDEGSYEGYLRVNSFYQEILSEVTRRI